MKKYVGVKLLQAEPMNLGEYNKTRGWTIPENEDPLREGYLVKYSDDYVSWSPKEIFENAYMQVGENNTIRQEDVDGFIKAINVDKFMDKTTVVHAELNNGYIITEASSCVDPGNYSEEIGKEICIGKIKDKVWGHLGFVLQCGVKGIK